MAGKFETATLAAGCFWCVEAVFGRLRGVQEVISGYTGGTVANPTYEEVCSGGTGHAEAVQIRFDPEAISFAELLEIFWRSHDPTTRNRQGADVGTQYRSAIFYHDERQRQIAETSRKDAQAAGLWPDPIVTEIVPFHHLLPRRTVSPGLLPTERLPALLPNGYRLPSSGSWSRTSPAG